jgi:hypothetical protein
MPTMKAISFLLPASAKMQPTLFFYELFGKFITHD